jgi:hypothetical protein
VSALDLFGMPVEAPPDIAPRQYPAPPAKPVREPRRAKAKPAPEAKRRLVAAPPPEPKAYEAPPPMAYPNGAPRPDTAPALPRLARVRLPALAACDCCGRPSTCQEAFAIEREHHPPATVRACEACRGSAGADFPRAQELSGWKAGPWCVALLREAGRIPYEPKRGHL